jgi:hypothetical protein
VKREEVEKRVARTEELLIEHVSSHRCVMALMREFRISERTAWRYAKKVRERWDEEAAELGPEERNAARERMRQTLRYVQGRGFTSGELRVVLGATTQLRALDGLDVPSEFRLSGAIGVVDTASVFRERSTEDLLAFLRTGRLPPEAIETGDE